MRALALIVFLTTCAGLAYWLLLRPVLRQRPELAAVYQFVDVWQAGMWAWLKLHLCGLRTKLVARMIWLGGLMVTFHDALATFAAALDWTPLTARMLAFMPADLRPLVVSGAVAIVGALFEWLRSVTDTPPGVPSQAVVAAVVEKAAEATGDQAAVPDMMRRIAWATVDRGDADKGAA